MNASLLDALRARAATRQAEADRPMPEWLAENVVLPRGGGAAPYDWRVTPYWRHWQAIAQARITGRPLDHDPDAHRCEQVWIVCGNQIGKTFGYLVPLLAWLAALHPRAMGLVYPRNDDVRRARDARVRPMLEKSPGLAGLLPAGQAELEKRLGTKLWRLTSCDWHWLVGNASLDLRSLDLPVVALDEFDLLALDVDGEGDPIELLLDRQKTYPLDRLALGTTTPTLVTGHGWARLCSGSHERLHIQCPACGAHHWLDASRLAPDEPGMPADEVHRYDLAAWHCPTCDHGHHTPAIRQTIAAACADLGWSEHGGWVPGRWIADDGPHGGTWSPIAEPDRGGRFAQVAPPADIIRTAQLGSLYSPFISLGEYCAHRLRALAKTPEAVQAHVNGWDGLPWIQTGDGLDAETIESTRAPVGDAGYRLGSCPLDPWRLVITADQQGNAIETTTFPWVARAWHADGSSHLVDAGHAHGFAGLEEIEARAWLCGGVERQASALAVDSANGNMQRHLRRWCAKAPRRRISLAGSGTMADDTPWAELRRTARNAHRLQGLSIAFIFNAHVFRDALAERMRGQGWRIPTDAPDWYMASLGSEERVSLPTLTRGRRIVRTFWRPREWSDENGRVHIRRDNHWWDCEVMQAALVAVLGWYKRKDSR